MVYVKLHDLAKLPPPRPLTFSFFWPWLKAERGKDFHSRFCLGWAWNVANFPLLRSPNHPGCANFASKLRHLIIGAISTQPCYVSTLCVEFARIIRFCTFTQIWRMRRRMRWIYAKKNCKKYLAHAPKNNRKKKSRLAGRIRTRDLSPPTPPPYPLCHPAFLLYEAEKHRI